MAWHGRAGQAQWTPGKVLREELRAVLRAVLRDAVLMAVLMDAVLRADVLITHLTTRAWPWPPPSPLLLTGSKHATVQSVRAML